MLHLQATTEQILDLSSDVCPALSHQLFQQVIPLCSIDESLKSVETSKLLIQFPFDSSSSFCYSYSLKLAYLFCPTRRDLHELILSRMDINNKYLEPYLLEIGCVVGQCIGTESKYFRDLF